MAPVAKPPVPPVPNRRPATPSQSKVSRIPDNAAPSQYHLAAGDADSSPDSLERLMANGGKDHNHSAFHAQYRGSGLALFPPLRT
jgi:hypothetical protein